MKKFLSIAAMAAFAMTSFTASAVDNNGAELTFDPAPGAVLDKLPETITLKITGPEAIEKPKYNYSNEITLRNPNGDGIRISANPFDGEKMELTFPVSNPNLKKDLTGVWKVELAANKIVYKWDLSDKSKDVKNVAYTYEFTVGTSGGDTPENPDDPKGDAVKYDITMNPKTSPALEGFGSRHERRNRGYPLHIQLPQHEDNRPVSGHHHRPRLQPDCIAVICYGYT